MLVLEITAGVFLALIAKHGLDALVAQSAQRAAERRKIETLGGAMDGFVDKLKEEVDREHLVQKALRDATLETGDRPPKPSEFKKIEARFHELTGGKYYLKLSSVKGEKRPGAEVSDKPFKTTPAKKAPVKKPVAKKKVTAKKGK